jgi:acetyltransferase-like isoleucine patch superfamily enzyme
VNRQRDNRPGGWGAKIKYYLSGQSTSLGRYVLEQTLFLGLAWIPTLAGIGLRTLAYRLIMRLQGFVAIESGVRLGQPANISLGPGVYLDQGVYLHACPQGIEIGADTYVMHHATLQVYHFRGIPHSGIKIGRRCFIGEFSLIRGQGGVTIGDRVFLSPLVQIMAVNHVYDDPTRPLIEQGITAEGIVIENDVWIGAGAIVLDGVRIGRKSVIGAGAVVTRDVPPHSLAVGVPARVTKDLQAARGGKVQAEDSRQVWQQSILTGKYG